jgi:uncharacterized protein (TIGR02145 family)
MYHFFNFSIVLRMCCRLSFVNYLLALLLLNACRVVPEIAQPPVVTTLEVTDISTTTAKGGGIVAGKGGELNARGLVWHTSPKPTLEHNSGSTYEGISFGTFESIITGLTHSTTYYVRAYATNILGDKYGEQVEFTTTSATGAPVAAFVANVRTGAVPFVVNFTDQSANKPNSWIWNFGDGTNSSLQNPIKTFNKPGSYTISLTAVNDIGSNTRTKENYINAAPDLLNNGLPCPGTPAVIDVDGNTYNTVLIGNQCWMKENLRTTKYRDGSPVYYPGNNNTLWSSTTTGAYAWYGNDISWKNTYGALYNWFAVNSSEGLCPAGWHIPSKAELDQLVGYVVAQGYSNNNIQNGAANALKSCRQVDSPFGTMCNTNAHPRWGHCEDRFGFDAFGFAGLGGGLRLKDFDYIGLENSGIFWSSMEQSSDKAWGMSLDRQTGQINVLHYFKITGLSVRCLKD